MKNFVRIRKYLAWVIAAGLGVLVGTAVGRFLITRGSRFHEINSAVYAESGTTDLVVRKLTRRGEVIEIPLYLVVLRDKGSGSEIPLVTIEEVFQEPSYAPKLISQDHGEITLSAGKKNRENSPSRGHRK